MQSVVVGPARGRRVGLTHGVTIKDQICHDVIYIPLLHHPSIALVLDNDRFKENKITPRVRWSVYHLLATFPPVVFSRFLDGRCLRQKYDTPFLTPPANIVISRPLRRHRPLPLSASSSWFRIRMKWFVAYLSHCSHRHIKHSTDQTRSSRYTLQGH